MGYDMRFRKADPDEAAAVAEAQKIFRAACDARDALPDSERGRFNMERAKASGDFDSEDNYDGQSPRYRAAADQVHAAYRAMNDAERSYFPAEHLRHGLGARRHGAVRHGVPRPG